MQYEVDNAASDNLRAGSKAAGGTRANRSETEVTTGAEAGQEPPARIGVCRTNDYSEVS
jgi:hypothetical protein